MSDFRVNTITNRDGSYGPQVCGITTFGSSGIKLPSGPTTFRGRRGRAIFAGGYEAPSNAKEIQTVEIATTGNAVDFGDQLANKAYGTAVSSPTRAVNMGGFDSPAATNVIEYVEIATTGNAVDFGDADTGTIQSAGGVSNGHGGL